LNRCVTTRADPVKIINELPLSVENNGIVY